MRLIQIIKLLFIKIVTCSSNDQTYNYLKSICQAHKSPSECFKILQSHYDKIAEEDLGEEILMVLNWLYIFAFVFLIFFMVLRFFINGIGRKRLFTINITGSIILSFSILFYTFGFSEMLLFDSLNFKSLHNLLLYMTFYTFSSLCFYFILLLKSKQKMVYVPLIIIYGLLTLLITNLFLTNFIYYYYSLISLSICNIIISLILYGISFKKIR